MSKLHPMAANFTWHDGAMTCGKNMPPGWFQSVHSNTIDLDPPLPSQKSISKRLSGLP
jgi:hypothetical protein